MGLKKPNRSYGFVAQCVHWAMALAVMAMVGVGYWMTELEYQDP